MMVAPEKVLTERQLEVLQALAELGNQRDAADRLGITVDAVAKHLQRIEAKLGVATQTAAVAEGFRRGLLH